MTNNTYIFNSTRVTYDNALSTCKLSGGHLVSWFSLEEQVREAGPLS